MDIETFLLWFSRISLVFWSGVLVWCIASIVIRQRKEQKWLENYVPTLKGDLREPDVHSWVTLDALEERRGQHEAAKHASARKKKKAPVQSDDE